MIYYVLAVMASVCFASQFCAMKMYQKHTENNFTSSLVFVFGSNLLSFLIFFIWGRIAYGTALHFTATTVWVSVGFAVTGIISNFNSIKIMSYGHMSIYSLFMMLGGMALPFMFGLIVYSEVLTDMKLLGMIILIVSLVLSTKDKKAVNQEGEGKVAKAAGFFYLLCVIAFVLNGSTSILSDIQGKATEQWSLPVSELYDYLAIKSLITMSGCVVIVPFLFLMKKEKRDPEFASVKKIFSKEPILAWIVYTAISTAGFVFQQICTPHLDASVLFPITTGGTIVISTVLARIIYKENTSKFMWFCIGLTAVATVLFMLGSMFPTEWFVGLFA